MLRRSPVGPRSGRDAIAVALVALTVILLTSGFLTALTPTVHATITGTPNLGTENSATAPSSFTPATSSLTVIAGTDLVTSLDGSPTVQPALLTVAFNGVTFSGASFYLYMSMDGNAEVSPSLGDIQYAGPFSAAQLSNPTMKEVTSNGATYYYGKDTASNEEVLVGPIPTLINASYQYIKVYDGSCGAPGTFTSCSGTGVAGANELIGSGPGITISPSSGPAGTLVTVNGGSFPVNTKVDIKASYSTAPWVGGNKSNSVLWVTDVSTGSGFFTVTAPMLDTKQVINPKSTGPFTAVTIALSAVSASNTAQVLNTGQESYGPPSFREFSRGIASVTSFSSSGAPIDTTDGAFTLGYLYGNDSGTTGTVGPVTVRDLPVINVEVFGTLHIAGNFSYVGKPVTFWVGPTPATSVQMNTSAPVVPDSTGSWKATVTIPPLTGGLHSVWILNDGVYYGTSDGVTGTTTTTTSSTTTSITSTTTSIISSSTSSSTSTTQITTTTPSASTTLTQSTTTSQLTTTHSTTSTTSRTSTSSTASSTGTPAGIGNSVFQYALLGVVAFILVLGASFVLIRGRRLSQPH
jgi:hypothetical protein